MLPTWLGRELPFVCPWEGRVLRGSIDLLYRAEGQLWVADYETDREAEAEGARRYAPQSRAYAEAVRQTLGETPGFKVIFLRSGKSVEVT